MKLLKCNTCQKIVEVVMDSSVPVICCGQPMVELVANTTDGATEKHVPVVLVEDDQLIVKVGEIAHPMVETHWITSIIVVMGQHVLKTYLNPNDLPETSFSIGGYKGHVEVYEYCNLHGLWKTELDI